MPSHRGADQVPVHIYVPQQVKADFAAAARRNGETMTGALEAFMRSYTKELGMLGAKEGPCPRASQQEPKSS